MKLSFVSLVLAALVSTATASADPIDAAMDAEIGLPTVVQTDSTSRPTPAPVRDPSTAGTRLSNRRAADYLRFVDADEGHRILVETPAPVRHGHRSHRHGDFASR